MDNLDVGQEWEQLRETYSLMSEDELSAVAEDAYDLTPLAQEALQAVIRERGFTIHVKTTKPLAPPAPGHSDDSDLEVNSWVANMDEARQVKATLNEGGVPCFFGPDNVLELEDFKGSFDRGVQVKVRVVDRDRARLAKLRAAEAADPDYGAPDPEEEKKYAVVCPKCRSEEVIFEQSEPGKTDLPADSLFKWRCDSCGYEWEDDGVAKPL
jgi:DNA-directed RNA polymerase subunit M/transcription elongation factor TFIIS